MQQNNPQGFAHFGSEAACEQAVGPLIQPCLAKANGDKSAFQACIKAGLPSGSSGSGSGGGSAPTAASVCANVVKSNPKVTEAACEQAVGPLIQPCLAKANGDKSAFQACIKAGLASGSAGGSTPTAATVCANIVKSNPKITESACEQAVGPLIQPCLTKANGDKSVFQTCVKAGLARASNGGSAPTATSVCANIVKSNPKITESACEQAVGPLIQPCLTKANGDKSAFQACIKAGLPSGSGKGGKGK